ncbi:MAG: serine/threonine-protein kinase [Rubripirellula sp.]
MANDLEPTIALEPANPNLERSRIRVGSYGGSNHRLNDLFGESTRRLLRERLIIASVILAMLFSSVQVIVWFNGTILTNATFARVATIGCLAGIVLMLWRRPELTLRQLRWLEIFVVVVSLAEMLLIQHIKTTRLLEIGKPQQVPELIASIGGVICLLVATYAMFIPSNWRRTAVVAVVSAALHTILTALQFSNVAGLREVAYPSYTTPFLLCATGIVAITAAHFVRSIRHEVESARQYGQYHLTNEIGRGGMGVVYRAEHWMLKRPAAIKLIRAESAKDEIAIARFEKEVQVSATLSHWNTVQIYDYGRTAGGDFYYVMEHLAGKTLAQRLKDDGPLEPEAAVNVIRQVCNGLEEAHAKTLVHRDLKPANIFLSDCGSQCNLVKILDFGLATSHASPDQDRRVSGSPPYMSPVTVHGSVQEF